VFLGLAGREHPCNLFVIGKLHGSDYFHGPGERLMAFGESSEPLVVMKISSIA
jgi:hypothetical protein